MKLNTPFLKKITFLLLSLFFILSCNKDDIPQKQTTGINTGVEAINNETTRLDKVLTSETITTNFSITVIDEDNNPISNAIVKVSNKEAQTNNNGFTLIEDITVNKDFQAINVTANGYTPSIKTITPSTNGVSNVTVTLLKPTFIKTFSATEGGIVSNDNISIEFPKDAIADQNGDLYEGEVKTTVTYYNPNSETFVQSMPGTLVGLDDNNSLQALISKGMIKVDLTDNNGNELEIFEGKEATIKLPASNNDPTTIPLWHLNEEKGLWVQTGTATKNGNQYIASVKHFSTYNLDVPGETIDLTVVLKDTNNQLLANQKAVLKATNNNGIYKIEIETDNKGEFKIFGAPKNADYNLDVINHCENVLIPLGVLNKTSIKELVLTTTSNARNVTLEGTLKKCNSEIWANKVFIITLQNGSQFDKLTAYTDSNGNYKITKVLCDYNTTTNYKGKVRIFDEAQDVVKDDEFLFSSNSVVKYVNTCNGQIELINERVYDEALLVFGELLLNTNAKYNEFVAGGYTRVPGDLTIDDLTINDLSGLTSLNKVDGILAIGGNNNLINLNGLKNLTSVKSINIIENNSLINLEGLENIFSLNSQYGNLGVYNNSSLKTLKGLDNLINVGGILTIGKNPNIENLENLIKLKSIGYLQISDNENLKNLSGLDNLISLTGTNLHIVRFHVEDNSKLSNFCAIKSLVTNNQQVRYNIYGNAFNPSKQDIIDGNCSQ